MTDGCTDASERARETGRLTVTGVWCEPVRREGGVCPGARFIRRGGSGVLGEVRETDTYAAPRGPRRAPSFCA